MRNIVNGKQIELFLKQSIDENPDWETFISGSVRNYLYRSAPIKINLFYYLNYLIGSKEEKEILAKGDIFHNVIINNDLRHDVQNIIDFFEEHKGFYKDKQSLGFLDAKRLHDSWIKKLNKRIVTEEGEIEQIYTFKDGHSVVKLIDKKSYEREGSMMHNCVASHYGKTQIYSIRDDKNQPMVTFSSQGNNIGEIKEKRNQPLSSKYKEYLNEFAKKRNFKFQKFVDAGNAGFASSSFRLMWAFFILFKWKEIINFLGVIDVKKISPEMQNGMQISIGLFVAYQVFQFISDYIGDVHRRVD